MLFDDYVCRRFDAKRTMYVGKAGQSPQNAVFGGFYHGGKGVKSLRVAMPGAIFAPKGPMDRPKGFSGRSVAYLTRQRISGPVVRSCAA